MTERDEKSRRAFDLEDRTARFGEDVIAFARKLPGNAINKEIVQQLVRAGMSVGANYCEADDSESGKDFVHKVALCRKESREVKHWLRMAAAAEPGLQNETRMLWQEAKELNLIFGSIFRNKRGQRDTDKAAE